MADQKTPLELQMLRISDVLSLLCNMDNKLGIDFEAEQYKHSFFIRNQIIL